MNDPAPTERTREHEPTVAEARTRLRQAASRCDRELSFAANPWIWIGAAVAAGFVVGASPATGYRVLKSLALSSAIKPGGQRPSLSQRTLDE